MINKLSKENNNLEYSLLVGFIYSQLSVFDNPEIRLKLLEFTLEQKAYNTLFKNLPKPTISIELKLAYMKSYQLIETLYQQEPNKEPTVNDIINKLIL